MEVARVLKLPIFSTVEHCSIILYELQHEYTFLMYLTPEWKEDMYGETIFFEEVDKYLKKKRSFKVGNEKYETLGWLLQ